MVRHELGKWNLDELVKNPNRAIIDKKIARIESDSKRFEKIKKSLNPKVSSGKFLTVEEYCKNIIKEVLEDVFLDNLIDVATLSSTHLPFLEPFLRSIFKNVKFLDPAKNISNVLKDFVEDNDLQQNVLRIFTSGDVKLFKKNLQMM